MEKDVNDPSNSGIRNVGGSRSSNTQTSVKSSTDSQDVDSLYMNINSSGNFPSIVPDSKVPEKRGKGERINMILLVPPPPLTKQIKKKPKRRIILVM